MSVARAYRADSIHKKICKFAAVSPAVKAVAVVAKHGSVLYVEDLSPGPDNLVNVFVPAPAHTYSTHTHPLRSTVLFNEACGPKKIKMCLAVSLLK